MLCVSYVIGRANAKRAAIMLVDTEIFSDTAERVKRSDRLMSLNYRIISDDGTVKASTVTYLLPVVSIILRGSRTTTPAGIVVAHCGGVGGRMR